MLSRRLPFILAALLVAAPAFAQQLRAPNYYLFQVPRLEAGQPITATLSTDAGQNFKDGSYVNVYAFQGRSGDRISVTVASWEFDTYVTMFDPDGYLVGLNDEYIGGEGVAGIDATLYVDGTYLVVVSGYSQWDTGEYTIELTSADSGFPSETASIAIPGGFESQVRPDMPLHPNGYVGPTEYFSLKLDEASLLLINASSFDFDTFVTLFDEFGNEIAQNDDHDFSSDSRLAVPLLPGAYVLAVSSYYSGDGGTYTVTIDKYVQVP